MNFDICHITLIDYEIESEIWTQQERKFFLWNLSLRTNLPHTFIEFILFYLLSKEELYIYIDWKLIGFTRLIVENCCCVYLFVVVGDRVDICGEIQVTKF